MARIGFISFWGWPRGQSYVTLGFAKMLEDKHDVFILKQGKNKDAPEFKNVNVEIFQVPNYELDKKVFKLWVTKNKLDVVVFNEYNQWNDDGNNLIKLTKELGAKAYGFLVWERWQGNEQYKDYDRILVPTVSYERFMRVNKFRKFTYIPYSIDLKEFPKDNKYEKKKDKFTFFHPGGFGGVHNRKNTEVILNAFNLLNDKNTELVITSQKQLKIDNLPKNVIIIDKELSRKELIDLYYKADATILPSKWETIGLPILESLAAGVPVITSNVPPMNEFIQEGMNGYLCNPNKMTKYEDIYVRGAEISAVELKIKMQNIMNKLLHPLLKRNSRYIIEEIYDLEKNKKYFLDFLKKDLNEKKEK